MKTVINIKTDVYVKREAKKIAEELGLSLSAVVNAYLKQFVRSQEAHFSLAPQMSPELEELLGPIERDIQHGRNLSREFTSVREMKQHLAAL